MLKPSMSGSMTSSMMRSGRNVVDLLERPVPAGGGLDVEALVAQRHRDELGDGLLVVDDEDARSRFSSCHPVIVTDEAGSLLRERSTPESAGGMPASKAAAVTRVHLSRTYVR